MTVGRGGHANKGYASLSKPPKTREMNCKHAHHCSLMNSLGTAADASCLDAHAMFEQEHWDLC